jgi:hypothetical protein
MSRKPSISDIEYAVRETSPYFFSKATLKFFGQTKSSFKVYNEENGKYLISAPMKVNGRIIGYTQRHYNPATKKLETVKD